MWWKKNKLRHLEHGNVKYNIIPEQNPARFTQTPKSNPFLCLLAFSLQKKHNICPWKWTFWEVPSSLQIFRNSVSSDHIWTARDFWKGWRRHQHLCLVKPCHMSPKGCTLKHQKESWRHSALALTLQSSSPSRFKRLLRVSATKRERLSPSLLSSVI